MAVFKNKITIVVISLFFVFLMIFVLLIIFKDNSDYTFMNDLTMEEAALLYAESFFELDAETMAIMFYDEDTFADSEKIYSNTVNKHEGILEDYGINVEESVDEISYVCLDPTVYTLTSALLLTSGIDEDTDCYQVRVKCYFEEEEFYEIQIVFAQFNSKTRIYSFSYVY